MPRLFLFAAVALFILPASANAWNATGHSVVSLVAYRELAPADQQKVQTLLKAHPQYNDFLVKNVPANANRDEWIVMQASVWPDWIKGGSREIKAKYNKPDWHYVNVPIR